jgi:flagellar basal-body rod protein FlgC
MALSDILNIAGSGMNAQVVRMNTTASNLANAGVVSTTEGGAFRARRPVFEAILSSISGDAAQGGVRVTEIIADGSSPKRVFEPTNPASDEEGYVYASNVNEVAELIEMLDASRAYQNNVEVVTATRNLLSSTLEVLKTR